MSGKRSLLFVILTVLYIVLAVAAVHYFFPVSLSLLAFSLLFALVVCWILFKIIDAFFLSKIINYLDWRCDPETYLAKYKNYYGLSFEQTSDPIHLIYQCVGLIALGQIDKVSAVLDRIYIGESDAYGRPYGYYLGRMCVELERNNLAAAEYYLNTMEQDLNTAKPFLFEREIFLTLRQLILFNRAEILRIKGNLIESKEILETSSGIELPKLIEVTNLYNLGLIESELGNAETAKGYFMRVVNEGNKLFLVVEARQKLAELARAEFTA